MKVSPRTYYWTIHHRDGSTTNYKTALTTAPKQIAKYHALQIARAMGGYDVSLKKTVLHKNA